MERTLGIHPNRGFSLLELLMVLLFMSLLGSILFPQLSKIRDASLFNSEKLQLTHAIQSLPLFCMQNGRAIQLDKIPTGIVEIDKQLNIPKDWNIIVQKPLVINANGFCLDGQLVVKKYDRELSLKVISPNCQVQTTGIINK